MPLPYHGKDGRLRDRNGRIRFEYDRNDARHIQQALDHPQLGHEGQYANCEICHDYTPATFKTYWEVDADTRRRSQSGAPHESRHPILSGEEVAPGMDPLSLRHAPAPSWLRGSELSQQRPYHHADSLSIAPERYATYSESSEWTNDEPPPPRRVRSPASSVGRSIASQFLSTSGVRDRSCHRFGPLDIISIDDAVARILRRKADIQEARSAYRRGEVNYVTTALVRSFVGEVYEMELQDLDVQLDELAT